MLTAAVFASPATRRISDWIDDWLRNGPMEDAPDIVIWLVGLLFLVCWFGIVFLVTFLIWCRHTRRAPEPDNE